MNLILKDEIEQKKIQLKKERKTKVNQPNPQHGLYIMITS